MNQLGLMPGCDERFVVGMSKQRPLLRAQFL
jgi:hypothetical protein